MRGCITRRGKKSWRLKFDLDRDLSRERRVRYVTVKGTRKDAETELARLLNDANRGVLVDQTKTTVAKHLHDWLGGKDNLSALSRERYLSGRSIRRWARLSFKSSGRVTCKHGS
jgi:integrase